MNIFTEMNTGNILLIVLVSIAALALVLFMIWKNNQDKKRLNPDSDDSVKGTLMDKDRRGENV